ncbi:DUF2635 domain-containing protein [Microvirga terricola]|uniref:DUF2635 domain-containing protein n=1 Tax=Microvirga terricola TaxID=2719797 RepID=UPI00197C14E4|nr:DUF2635 domain-containing protein [Microvirga terricola]
MRDKTKIYAKPAEGRTVPLVDGSPWPAEGAWVDLQDRYYRRRLADEDIIKTDPVVAEATGKGNAIGETDPATSAEAGATATTDPSDAADTPTTGDDDARSATGRRKSR